MISIALVTFNRVHLLRQCVNNVLARTSPYTTEIVIWNNSSTDATPELLSSLRDPRIRVINSDKNVGTNAYGLMFPTMSGEFLIELDDDVIDAPIEWDKSMLDAFRRIPRAGYLAADVIDDGKSVASEIRYRRDLKRYRSVNVAGVQLIDGPTGGWCAMTSRAVFDEVGGFDVNKRFNFWLEDAAYIKKILRAGYVCYLLEDLKVFHASGDAFSNDPQINEAKKTHAEWYRKWIDRRKAIRRIIDRVPIFNGVYAKYRPRRD